MDRVRLAELCAATSLFTDLGTGQPAEHGLRTCLVAMRLARALGLAADVRGEVFYVSLLRFLGCTGQRLPQRLRALARALTDPKGGERLLEAHCEVGARLATEMGLPQRVAATLEFAYARWDGRGVPAGVAGEDIPASVRVSIVARDLELWARETSTEAARPGTSSHATHPDQWVATMIAFHDAIASRRVESR